MTETWLPLATRRDGPPDKQGYPSAPSRALVEIAGVVAHSMEGGMDVAMGELDKATRRASWTFSNPKVGPLLQHYPLESVTWASGSVDANRLFVAVEHEGVAGELINVNQRQNLADLLTALSGILSTFSWSGRWTREGQDKSLWEHREMVAYGSAPTACPSNRIPWQQVLALMEDDMTPEQDAILRDIQDWVKTDIPERLTALETAVAALQTGGVDYAALAKAVNDEAARRLVS